jgi:hypothetical protein
MSGAPFIRFFRRPPVTSLPAFQAVTHRGQVRMLTGDGSTTRDKLYFGRDRAGTGEWVELLAAPDATTGTLVSIQNNDVTVVATASTVDFSTDFAVTESPAGEGNVSLSTAARTSYFTVILNGGGSVIPLGVQADIHLIPGTITAWEMGAFEPAETGSIVVDPWFDTYANYPPTVADSIAGSEKPTISASNKGTDTSLNGGAGWAIASDGRLLLNVDSCSGITKASLAFKFVRA